MDVQASIRPYLVDCDPGDEIPTPIRPRMTRPPRPLQKGERWTGSEILYSAGWIDNEGAVHAFVANDA